MYVQISFLTKPEHAIPVKVYASALSMLKYILQAYLPDHKLVDSEGPRVATATYHALINRTGDTVNVGTCSFFH